MESGSFCMEHVQREKHKPLVLNTNIYNFKNDSDLFSHHKLLFLVQKSFYALSSATTARSIDTFHSTARVVCRKRRWTSTAALSANLFHSHPLSRETKNPYNSCLASASSSSRSSCIVRILEETQLHMSDSL
ncbi:hypothetical protein WMY93_019619 [Mugilogobius chulae]|uniref:Uncharacterized protein n=1 Tax=Mugilogobius chulae TaxID=88201 RepID=A0AAW0NRN9_9GOBI